MAAGRRHLDGAAGNGLGRGPRPGRAAPRPEAPVGGGGGSGHGASPRSTATSSATEADRPDRPTRRQRRFVDARRRRRPHWLRPGRRRAGPCPVPAAPSRRDRARRRRPSPSIDAAGTTSEATSTPTAMGRSSPAPPLRTPLGARFTVMRFCGQASPLDSSAARTRSLDSRQASSGRPTMVKPGQAVGRRGPRRCTGRPWAPSNVADETMASTATSNTNGHVVEALRAGATIGEAHRRPAL